MQTPTIGREPAFQRPDRRISPERRRRQQQISFIDRRCGQRRQLFRDAFLWAQQRSPQQVF